MDRECKINAGVSREQTADTMTENITITSQQTTAPLSPTPGAKTWAEFYGTPAVTTTVPSSVIVNPAGSAKATINIPLGN